LKVSLIVGMGVQREIGLNNKLLWHLPEDLKNFKNITMGHHLIMGRKTYDSIGRPLPGRISVVLSRDTSYSGEKGVIVHHRFEEALKDIEEKGEEEVMVIGGEQIYKLALPYADKIYLTTVDYHGDADAFFPPFELKNWCMQVEKRYEASKKLPSWIFQELTKK
jgi:dihydrofolate reductase